jgi:hypothetical protein
LLSGAISNPDWYDFLISRKVIEVYLLKKGISYDSIKSMTENDVLEYQAILQEIDKIEQDNMEKSMKR